MSFITEVSHVIAKITLKLRKYLNAVACNRPVLLQMKNWTVWYMERFFVNIYKLLKTVPFFGPPSIMCYKNHLTKLQNNLWSFICAADSDEIFLLINYTTLLKTQYGPSIHVFTARAATTEFGNCFCNNFVTKTIFYEHYSMCHILHNFKPFLLAFQSLFSPCNATTKHSICCGNSVCQSHQWSITKQPNVLPNFCTTSQAYHSSSITSNTTEKFQMYYISVHISWHWTGRNTEKSLASLANMGCKF